MTLNRTTKSRVRSMRPGDSVRVGSLAGSPIVLHKAQDGGFSVTGPRKGTAGLGTLLLASPCAYAVTAGLYALGASVLTLLAVLSGGAGIFVAGYFVSTELLYAAAATSGGAAALYTIVSQYMC